MKRISSIAALLVPILVWVPTSINAQDTQTGNQPNAQPLNEATGSIPEEPESSTTTPALQANQPETPTAEQPAAPLSIAPFNSKLDGQFTDWLAALNGIQGATARANFVRLRSLTNDLQISGLVIADPAYDLTIEVGSATFSNTSEPFGDYVLEAQDAVLKDLRIKLGETEFLTDDVVLTSVLLPKVHLSEPGNSQASQTKFERKREMVTELLRLVAGSISVPELIVRIYSDKDDTIILAESHYRDNKINGLKGSKIESLTLSSSQTLSPPLEPLIEERFGNVSIKNFDFQAITALFDGDRSAREDMGFFDAFSLADYMISIGGLDLRIDAVQMADVSVADIPETTEDQLIQIIESSKDLDAIKSDELPAFALQFLSLPSFGALSIQGLKVDALGIEDFGFDSLSFNDLSLSGMAVAQFSGFNAALEEIGAISLKSAGLAGLKLPGKDTLLALTNGEQVPSAELLPTLNSLSVSELNAQMPELGLEGSLEDFSLAATLDNSGVMTGMGLSVTDLKLPGALIPRDGTIIGRLGGIMDSIGLDTLQLNQVLSMSFDASTRTLSVSELTADIAELGGISMTANIENIGSSPFANPATAASNIRKGTLNNAKIVFTNAGVVEAGFEAQAQKLGTKGDTLRSQVGATLPFLLGVLQNPPFQQQLAKALQAFLPKPESLTIELNPETGVAIADIERQLRGDPRKLIGMLGTSIENTSAGSTAEEQSNTDAESTPENPTQTETPAE